MNILITTPSLDPKDNVSGISSVGRLLLQYNLDNNYIPFVLGKKDMERRGLYWFISLMKIPYRLFYVIKNNSINFCHFNIGFEPRSLLRDILPYLILSYKSIPLCLHIHGGRYMSSIPTNFFIRRIITFLLNHAAQIIVLSEIEADFLKSHYLKDVKRLHVVPNAVEIPSLLDKNYQEPLTLLYLGRIDRKKGLRIIADALTELENRKQTFKFYLCGVGPDKEWFMSLFPDSVKHHIIDVGLVYGASKKEILKASHVFLLPSLFEGLPMALLESMSFSVVPVVSPVGSMPDVVKDDYNGFLVKEASEMVSAITKLNNDRFILQTFAQRARETVENRFSIKGYIKRINEIYSLI